MAERSRVRPAHWVVLALAVAPAWKAVQWVRRPAPKAVSAEAVAAGRALFLREWSPGDSLASGDGLGPVFNARSCVECHFQGGPGGGGTADRNVTVFGRTGDTHGQPASGVVHMRAVSPEYQETLDLVGPGLPRRPSLTLEEMLKRSKAGHTDVIIAQRNTPALFGDGLIDVVPDDTLIAGMRQNMTAARIVGLGRGADPKVRGRISRLADGRIGRFGWKLEFASLEDFVKAACANELGLSNPSRPQAVPLGKPNYRARGTDLTDTQCVMIADYLRGLPAPAQVWPDRTAERATAERGRGLFVSIGCADCHVKDLGPVEGLYSDNLLHDLGSDLESVTGSYGSRVAEPSVRDDRFAEGGQPTPGEWRTAPLWGVADSAPYLHDGRAETLEQAVELHGGEAVDVASRFKNAAPADREALLAFLKTLRAPRTEEGPPSTRLARK